MLNQSFSSNDYKIKADVVFRLACLQAIVSVVMSLALYILYSRHAAISALIGGLICAAANLFFAGRLFVTKPDLTAESIVKRFYRSESMKIFFTLAMFVVFIAATKVMFLPFIAAYLVVSVIVNWLFLLVK